MSDDFSAPPPFDPASARATLARTLRDCRLAERGGAFELDGQPVARVRIEDQRLLLDLAKRPARSPDWDHAEARDHAAVRKFTEELKRRLARWRAGRGDD